MSRKNRVARKRPPAPQPAQAPSTAAAPPPSAPAPPPVPAPALPVTTFGREEVVPYDPALHEAHPYAAAFRALDRLLAGATDVPAVRAWLQPATALSPEPACGCGCGGPEAALARAAAFGAAFDALEARKDALRALLRAGDAYLRPLLFAGSPHDPRHLAWAWGGMQRAILGLRWAHFAEGARRAGRIGMCLDHGGARAAVPRNDTRLLAEARGRLLARLERDGAGIRALLDAPAVVDQADPFAHFGATGPAGAWATVPPPPPPPALGPSQLARASAVGLGLSMFSSVAQVGSAAMRRAMPGRREDSAPRDADAPLLEAIGKFNPSNPHEALVHALAMALIRASGRYFRLVHQHFLEQEVADSSGPAREAKDGDKDEGKTGCGGEERKERTPKSVDVLTDTILFMRHAQDALEAFAQGVEKNFDDAHAQYVRHVRPQEREMMLFRSIVGGIRRDAPVAEDIKAGQDSEDDDDEATSGEAGGGRVSSRTQELRDRRRMRPPGSGAGPETL